MRALLDTSVLIGDPPPGDVQAAISVASLAELHFGVLPLLTHDVNDFEIIGDLTDARSP
jgi:predicted nucleic acid-binding protein